MGFTKKILKIFFMIFIFYLSGLITYASSSFQNLETKINYESSPSKIKKMQLALTDFGLYGGAIDGNYDSVKDSLVNYQKSTGITKHLGYFGYKTLTSLKEDFPNIFDKITQKYLLMDAPATNVRKFIVSAYYSAIPGQERYSYSSSLGRYRNYYEAIAMQGKGTHGASGKGVHVGMLAAPRNYKFGTKIEFKGLGVGVVEDRGNAIVTAGTLLNSGKKRFEYDRIDIWMGYGDKGRIRAEKWGTRIIEGKVVPNTRLITMEFNDSLMLEYHDLKINAEKPKKENIIKLQKLLTRVNIYSGSIDGNFSSIKDNIINFQLKNNIIKSKTSNEAGYFGTKTYAALRKEFGGYIFKKKNNELDEDVALPKDIKLKLEKVHKELTYVINNKYGKNTFKAIRYREKIRIAIEKHIKKNISISRKKELKYLKSII